MVVFIVFICETNVLEISYIVFIVFKANTTVFLPVCPFKFNMEVKYVADTLIPFCLTRGDLFCYLTIRRPTQDDLSTVPYDERCK